MDAAEFDAPTTHQSLVLLLLGQQIFELLEQLGTPGGESRRRCLFFELSNAGSQLLGQFRLALELRNQGVRRGSLPEADGDIPGERHCGSTGIRQCLPGRGGTEVARWLGLCGGGFHRFVEWRVIVWLCRVEVPKLMALSV